MVHCIMWVILIMMSIQMVLSYNVTLSPKSITTEVDTDSVNFTCTIQLEIFEAISPHWILWFKDNTEIADKDKVLINFAKYSVHGESSVKDVNYTQILQVNEIEETDHGIYTCTLIFTSYPPTNKSLSTQSDSTLIIRNFIPQPFCSNISTTQQMILFCSCSPGNPQLILSWNGKDHILIATIQYQKQPLSLSYTVESESSNQWFTCRATSTGSTGPPKECVIGDQTESMTPTTSNTVSQKFSMSVDGKSTAITTTTTNKAIFHSPITMNITGTSHSIRPTAPEQNAITTSVNAKEETALPQKNSTSNGSPSSNNNTITIIIFAILAGVILMIVFIAILLLLRTHLKTSKNEEIRLKKCARENLVHSSSDIEYPVGETDIHNENQDHRHITIDFGDGQLGCEVYKNSIYETNTDDLDPFYAAVGHKNVEESQGNATTDDPKKTKDIYPLEDNPEYMSIEETALKKATAPPIKAEKLKKLTVNNYPAPNGDMYAQVNRSSISSSGRLSNIINEEDRVKNYRAPNGDMYAQVDKSSNSISERLSTHTNEENRVKNYPAPNGDMYAQVDRSSNSISDRLSTLLINEEQESVRRKKSERKNDKLRDGKMENIGVLKKSSRFIDNDDTHTTISEIAQNSDGEEETDEFTAAEDKEDDKHEDDNVSRTSVGSSGSIHYEVDSNAVYTKVLKSQKSTTD